jgi:hypothetical protein
MFPREALQKMYRRHFHDHRSERLLLSSLSFFVTFATTRALAHAVRNQLGPFRNVSTGSTHIHHSFWGIFSLLGMGYAWLLEIGTGGKGSRHGMRALSALYGAGAALTLDEYALWLKLQSDHKIRDSEYWQGGGRKSIYAVMSFGSLLLLSLGGIPVMRGLLGSDPNRDEGE